MALGLAALAAGPAQAATGDISTVAGNGANGYSGDGGPATSAAMSAPAGVSFPGSDLFISDFFNHTVRKVDSSGSILTIAGNGTAGFGGDGGPGGGGSSQLNQPADVATDAAGNTYIADFNNARIRKVSPGGTITTFAGTGVPGYSGDGGSRLAAQLNEPSGLDIDTAGNIYVTDYGNDTVRKITPGGIITTVAGNGTGGYGGDGGPATAAMLNDPTDVAVGGGGTVYIADFDGNRVRKVTPGGTITTIAGDGTAGYTGDGGMAIAAEMNRPAGVDVDSNGDVFVAEFGNNVIRKISAGGTITRVAGTGVAGFSGDGGPAINAQVNTPSRVTLSPDGDFYISDWGNHRVRRVDGLGSPDAPTLTSFSPASPSSSNTPRVIGSSQPGWTVRLYTNSTCTSAVAASGSAAQLASPGLAVTVPSDASTTFWATAQDAAGNVSGCSAGSLTYVEDSTPPAAPAIGSSPTSPGNDQTPTWSFSGEAGASFECRIVRGATVVSDWAACPNPKTYDLSAQADGSYTFSVRAKDAAGNTGPSASSSYQLDTAAPATSVDIAPPSPGSGRSPAWSFSSEAGAALQCRLAAGATVISDWAPCTSPKAYDLTGQPDGLYTFSARATDSAGNTGAAATSSYMLDTTAPAAPSIGSRPASPGKSTNPSWSFTDEPGASFQCKIARGATVVSDWAACSSPKSYDLSSQPDGTYTFSTRATDAAGNVSAASTDSYLLDTQAPAVPSIDSAPGSPGSGRSPSWSFSGESGASFECKVVRGATLISDWTACTSPRSVDLAGKPDGTYSFSVRATDTAGNTGAAAASSYQLDTTAPAAPSIDSHPSSPGHDAHPSWSLSAEAGAAVECRLTRGATVISDWASCSGSKSYDLSSQPDGFYTFSARATDAAGNTGTVATDGYAFDTTAPAASIDSQPSSPGNDATPSWSFSSEAGAGFECRLVHGATVVSDWASCSSVKSYDLSSQPDGSYSFSVRATDTAGNTGAVASASYVLDTSAPAPPSIDSAPASPSSSTSPSWSFSSEAGAGFECRLTRGATVVSDWSACSSPRSFDLSSHPDGTYSFSVRATDAAGNTGAAASASYQLDTTAPAAPSIGSHPASPGNDSNPSWSFSAEAGAGVECRLTSGATVVSDWASCSGSKSFDLSGRPDGGYTFATRATDAAGNVGPAASSDYDLDRSAPAAPSIDSQPASPGHDASPSWSFSDEPGASFECRLTRGATVVSDWSSCSGPKSYDLSSQPDGLYGFSVRATDAAGNVSPVASASYALDTGAPAAPSVDSAPSSPGHDQSPSWSFSAESGASVECRLVRGASVVSDWASCAGSKAYDLSSQPDGSYSIELRATDAAGNVSPVASSAYVLDTTPPATPTFDSQPDSPASDEIPSWSFSGASGAALECRLTRGPAVVSDWATCTSPRAYDLNSEPDGDYDFAVRARDDAGNLSQTADSSYTLDRSIPSVPVIHSTPGALGSDATPTWSFSGDSGVSFQCKIERGSTLVADWAACTDPKTFDLSGEADGSYSFSVRAVNRAHTPSDAASSSYELDRTAPGQPSIDSRPASPGNSSDPSWSFSGEAGASFQCRLDGSSGVVSDWGACTAAKDYDLAGKPDGSYTFAVRATDAAGNTGASSSSSYELDTTAPPPPSILSAPASPASLLLPAWAFSTEPGATVECRMTSGSTVVSDWSSCASPAIFSLLGKPDASYTFSARARDAAGNVGAPATSDYRLDTTGAVASIDSGPGATGNDDSPTWAFSAESGASFECRLERGAATVSDWGACTSPQSYDLSGQPDGKYTFSVRAKDAQANQGDPVSVDYDLDRAAPAAPAISSGPAAVSRERKPVWAFTGEAGAAFQCRLDAGSGAVSDWAACTSPKTYDLNGRGDGRYAISVRATDAAGNTGQSGTRGFELDTTPPAPPTFTDGPGESGDDATPRWAFSSSEDGATFECRLSRDGSVLGDWQACSSPQDYDLTDKPDGAYSLAVRATDAAGNVGAPASSDYKLARASTNTDDGDKGNAVLPDKQLPGGKGPGIPATQPAAQVQPQPGAQPQPTSAGDTTAQPQQPLPKPAASSHAAKPASHSGALANAVTGARSGDTHDAGVVLPARAGPKVLKALTHAVKAVASHADDSVFPGALIAIVMAFFAIQNRIDRNDPKLGLAPVFADPDLEFE